MAFNVAIKSEPKTAKGLYQCETSAQGLTLSQGKKRITIPVGVPTRYEGKNRFDVTLPDSRLTLTVSKFGSYQNRLAKDLATFLSTGGNPPNLADYKLPWYFYTVSVLPIGIPILTLGGAIPAVIGFGLAGTCFGISQKDEWSTTTRLIVCASVVLAGYIGVFVLLLAMAVARGA